MIKTKNGIPVATDFVRIVHGEKGSYAEFTKEQMILENIKIPKNTTWRLYEKWKDKVYYVEYRTTDNVMIYHQKQTVGYENYKSNCFYIDL